MKTIIASVMLMAAPALASAAGESYESGYALAQKKGCFECHAIGYTVVGPSFAAIARRHRFDAEARTQLSYVIRGGSAGHWGDRFVMWPQRQLSNEDVAQLVDWVLSQ